MYTCKYIKDIHGTNLQQTSFSPFQEDTLEMCPGPEKSCDVQASLNQLGVLTWAAPKTDPASSQIWGVIEEQCDQCVPSIPSIITGAMDATLSKPGKSGMSVCLESAMYCEVLQVSSTFRMSLVCFSYDQWFSQFLTKDMWVTCHYLSIRTRQRQDQMAKGWNLRSCFEGVLLRMLAGRW